MRHRSTIAPTFFALGLSLAGWTTAGIAAEPLDDRLGIRTAPIMLVLRSDVQADLQLETAARTDVVAAVARCEAAQDFVSREIVVHILEDAEEHIDFLETEISLIEKVGEQNYLQSQIGEGKES